LFSTGQYSFDSHESSTVWNLIDLKSGKISELTDDGNVSEIIWLGSSDSALLYINSTNADIPGGVELWVADTADFKNSYVPCSLRTITLTFLSVDTRQPHCRLLSRV
jgi:hypothetical protein